MSIEKRISQYVEKQFPAFYQDEGPQFISFVKAYYEWLEEPGNVAYKTRHLLEYSDIDTTPDEFLLYFKEKYLKNIQFDTATNKQLLVKHSLDLYRSKGTERSIDLFFKLVFGTSAEVKYPGERIFKLSDGVWELPKYLEITYNKYNINYVGKQIIGSESGATAFVEKYIRRRAGYGYVNMLYISGQVGTFSRFETLGIKSGGSASYPAGQTSTIVGSIDSVILQDNGIDFAIGDIVSFTNSARGVGGQARVTEIGEATGLIDFILHEGGWGYTTNATSIISEKVITANGIIGTVGANSFMMGETVAQLVTGFYCPAGSGITTGDILKRYNGANLVGTAEVLGTNEDFDTSTSNSFIQISYMDGPLANTTLYVNDNTSTVTVTTMASAGVRFAEVMGVSDNYQVSLTDINGTFSVGMNVYQRTTEGIYVHGEVQSISDDTLLISVEKGSYSNGETLFVDSNSSVNATVLSVDTSIGLHNIRGRSYSFSYSGSSNTAFTESKYLYQYSASGNVVASGLALHYVPSSNTAGSVRIVPIIGDFYNLQGLIYSEGNTAYATLSGSGTITDFAQDLLEDYANALWFAPRSNTFFTVDTISEGTGAGFDVGTIGETEVLYMGTDLINANAVTRWDNFRYNLTASNTGINVGDVVTQVVGANTVSGTVYAMTATLVRVRDTYGTFVPTAGANGKLVVHSNNLVNTNITSSSVVTQATSRTGLKYPQAYIRTSSMGFPKNPQANIQSTIYSCLDYSQKEVGIVDSLTGLDPGADYNVDPFVLVEERSIASMDRHDYVASVSNTNLEFLIGEKVSQSIANLTTYSLTVDHGVLGVPYENRTVTLNAVRDANLTSDTLYMVAANGAFVPGRDVNPFTQIIIDGIGDDAVVGDTIIYYTGTGNTAVVANNTTTTVTFANSTTIGLNVALTLDYKTFNPSTIVNNFIAIASNPYPNTTLLKYWVASGNTEVFGLTNAASYYAVEANSTGLRLATSSGGTVIDITTGVNELGHALSLQNTTNSGHLLSIYNNTFQEGEQVLYQVSRGNTAIGGLTNNTVYYAKSVTNTSIKLAATKGGSAIDLTSGLDQTGQLIISLPGWLPLDAVYSNSGAYGIIDSVSANTVVVKSVSNGTFAAPGTLSSNTFSHLTANVSASSLQQTVRTAKALVKAANSSTLLLKRIQFENMFNLNTTITGESSGATANLTAIVEDTTSLQIGLNANVEANVITNDGQVTDLKIIDSGYGYSNSEIIQFTSADGLRSGTVKVVLGGSGKGAGYYKSSKGFLSDSVCLHDGDYYQEYSYEIFSKLSVDRYSDMFKKVMHTAGTKFFGSAMVVEEDTVTVAIGESSVTQE